MSALYLGIDSGTQSTKAIVLHAESGEIIAQAHSKYSLLEGLPVGHLEQNPADWIRAVDEVIQSCCEQLGPQRHQIRGIGVSGQQHGLVILDAKNDVIRPAKLWCDTSTTEQCDEIAHHFGGQPGCIHLTGNPVLPGYTLPKLLWVKQNEPENFAKISSILLPHDYINFYLTGVKRMEYGDASGTGALNIQTRQWNQEILDFIDPKLLGCLPPLGSSLEPHGKICPKLAEHWGLSPDIWVSAGGGDNMMGAIGTGNVTPGVITASFGTSGTLYATSQEPVIDGQGEVAAFCDSTDQWLPLVCTMNVTVVTEHVRKMYGWTIPELEEKTAQSPPGAEGLLFLPYLNGERTPNLPNGTGVIHGLQPHNFKPENFARAAVEGATLGLAYGLRRFRDLGIRPTEIRLTGGGSQSHVWRQIAADIFQTEVVTLVSAEGAALGAALQALFVVEHQSHPTLTIQEVTARFVKLDKSTRCKPNTDLKELYLQKLIQFSHLTQRLHEVELL